MYFHSALRTPRDESVFRWAAGWKTKERQGQDFFFSVASGLTLGPAQSHFELAPEQIFKGVKPATRFLLVPMSTLLGLYLLSSICVHEVVFTILLVCIHNLVVTLSFTDSIEIFFYSYFWLLTYSL